MRLLRRFTATLLLTTTVKLCLTFPEYAYLRAAFVCLQKPQVYPTFGSRTIRQRGTCKQLRCLSDACYGESNPRVLASSSDSGQEFAFAWKPSGMDDRDFITWAATLWACSGTSLKLLYNLGRSASGLCVLTGSQGAFKACMHAWTYGLCSKASYAGLVEGIPTALTLQRLSARGLDIKILRSSKGLRHGTLSLLLVTSSPPAAIEDVGSQMAEAGLRLRGPGGCSARRAGSQLVIVSLSILGLFAQVDPPNKLHDMMNLDAVRLRNRKAPLRESDSTILFTAENGDGWKLFEGVQFKVRQNVFVPRGESRKVIEAALQVPVPANPKIADLTVGNGILLLTLLRHFSSAAGLGIDISEAATALAAENAELQGLGGRARFFTGNLRELPGLLGINGQHGMAPFDLVVANPPYHKDKSQRMASYAHPSPSENLSGHRPMADMLQAPGVLTSAAHVVLQVPVGEEKQVAEVFASRSSFEVKSMLDGTVTFRLQRPTRAKCCSDSLPSIS